MEAPIRKLVRIKTMETTAHNTTITLEECQLLDLENWGERVADECGGRGVAPIMCGLWMQIDLVKFTKSGEEEYVRRNYVHMFHAYRKPLHANSRIKYF